MTKVLTAVTKIRTDRDSTDCRQKADNSRHDDPRHDWHRSRHQRSTQTSDYCSVAQCTLADHHCSNIRIINSPLLHG